MDSKEEKEGEDERRLLQERIIEAESLLDQVETVFGKVPGVAKLRHKLEAEIRFLNGLKSSNESPRNMAKFIDTSNVIHFRGLFTAVRRYSDCVAVYKRFSEMGNARVDVDLVVEGGAKWLKVISRSARGLALEFVGGGSRSSRTVSEQAVDYIRIRSSHFHLFDVPQVLFEFIAGVPDDLARELRSLGVTVIGNEIAIGSLVQVPEEDDDDAASSSSSSSTHSSNNRQSSSIDKQEEESNGIERPINLDVTAVFVMVTALCHTDGARYRFESKLLNAQAIMERRKPALPSVLEAIAGRRLIICRTAFDSVQSILSTVGGEAEKKRAEQLFQRVTIVDDCPSVRAQSLALSDRINARSKVIFATGDHYRAVTLTANRHFLRAAAHQGVNFAVIMHDSRALSEQKQQNASVLIMDDE